MKLYLDMCALKRPYDDRSDRRINEEATAILAIITDIESGRHELVWSAALTYENDADPDPQSRGLAWRCRDLCSEDLPPSGRIRGRVEALVNSGLKVLDAAHLAFAEAAECEALVTCDDALIRKARKLETSVRVVNPLEL